MAKAKGCKMRVKGGKRCSMPLMPGTKYCEQHKPKKKIEITTFAVGTTKFRGEKTVKTSRYDEYLQSEEWKNKASSYKKNNPNCGICNRTGILHVHHRTYVRCGKEEVMDLIVLCSECHKLFHDHYKYDGRVGYFKPKGA